MNTTTKLGLTQIDVNTDEVQDLITAVNNNAEVLDEARLNTIINTESTTSIQLVKNTEYRRLELATLTITLPAIIDEDFISSVVFTSGSSATTISYPSEVKFQGIDVINGIYTPLANRRYNIIFWYDGVYTNAVVGGVSI